MNSQMALDNVGKNIARRHPPNTAISLKKGNLIHPPLCYFLKRKTAALIFILKPPFGIENFIRMIITAETTVFYSFQEVNQCSAAKKTTPNKNS
ncbi:hypothetical protein [Pelotomaculum sp. FP]|uniref:hypothetical protein n=1 Tax=Pelotomaculum sp. FP TaxID=261474 RepID=UPI001066D6DF|nr:hypothetical protein [Pelotomaculum sp. FP]